MSAERNPRFAASARIESAVISFEGELDFAVKEQARAAIERCAEARVMVVDLRELTFMDTTGIHLLVQAREQCRASGRVLLVVPGPPNIQRGFAALELESEFTFVDAP